MENRSTIFVAFGMMFAVLMAAMFIALSSHSITVNAQSKSMQTVFQHIQQQAKADPKFPFTVESYGPTTNNTAVGISTINASANSIVEIGDDYVCMGSIQMSTTPDDIKTVCIPFSSIVRVYAQNTLFK